MSLTSYRAAPPRVNRAPYLINGLADGKEMLGGRTEALCASLVAPRGGGRQALTPCPKGDTPGQSEPARARMARMDEEEEEKQAEKAKDPEFLTRQLFAARSIFIFGPIEQELAKSVCAQLVALSQAGNDPINIYINSPGGHVESGDSIYDFIKFVR